MWSLGGQFVSSSGNFLVTFLVLTVASQAEFTVFSVCFTSYLLVAVVYRALVPVPITLLYSGERSTAGAIEQQESVAVGFGVISGCIAAVPVATASALFESQRHQFLIVALALPFLFYQDGGRYVSFARRCPSMAAFSDGLWVLLQVAASLLMFALGRASTASLLAAWAVAGVVAGGVTGVRLHLYPRFSGAVGWVRGHWGLCRRLVLECLVTSGGYYATLYGLVVVSSADELAYLKAAQTVLGPVSVLLLGGAALGVPESVRTLSDGPRLQSFTVRLSLCLVTFTLVCGLAVYFTLPALGPHLFSTVWADARPLIPLLVVFNAALGASTGPISSLRALGDTAWVLRGRSASSLVVLAVGLPAGALLGANGALLGLALAESLLAVAAWRRFHRLLPPAPANSAVS